VVLAVRVYGGPEHRRDHAASGAVPSPRSEQAWPTAFLVHSAARSDGPTTARSCVVGPLLQGAGVLWAPAPAV